MGSNSDKTKDPGKLTKSEQTKERLLKLSLELFQRKGFENTTMRELAEAAGLSPGAFYYHFASKEAVIQVFYESTFAEFQQRAESAIEKKQGFEEALEHMIRARMDTFSRHRPLLKLISRAAVDPSSELSPFGPGTKEIRERTIALFAQLLKAKGTKMNKALEPYMPTLLWMYLMGIVLFWMFDESKEQKRTYLMIEELTPQVARLIYFSRLPLTGSVIKPITRALAIAIPDVGGKGKK
jgi:AcrR family transcriptional regulator